MSAYTRIFLGLVGVILLVCGFLFMFTPYPRSVGVMAGIIAFISGGVLLGIAIFK